MILVWIFPVDKLLSSEDGGGIFDDPPAITESVMMPPDHGDDEDDFDNLQSRKKIKDIWLKCLRYFVDNSWVNFVLLLAWF